MNYCSKGPASCEWRNESGRPGGLVAAALAILVLIATACTIDEPPMSGSRTPGTVAADDERFAKATVVNVVDGVTIDVERDGQMFRVRYLGIEVPGTDAPGPDGVSLGKRARDFNVHLVMSQTVELEKGMVDTDSFGHLIRYVYVDGEMVNKALLTNGYATVAGFPADFKHKTSFALAEEGAKNERRGLWTSPSPVTGQATLSPTPAVVQPFSGGTLPVPPSMRNKTAICDYSGTVQPVIKGNIDRRTGEHIYHVPGSFFYSKTEVSESDGDRWFCTEEEASAAGWKRAKH